MVKINNAFLFMHYHLHNLLDSAHFAGFCAFRYRFFGWIRLNRRFCDRLFL